MLELLSLKRESFGMDISDLSLKIAKLGRGKDGLYLASFGETKIPPGIIKGGIIKDEKKLAGVIKEALAGVKGEKIKTKNVIASLPEEKAFMQVIQMPLLPEEDLRSAVIFEAENYVPLPIEQVYLDSQVIPPLHDHIDHYDVLIAAIPRTLVDPYVNSLKMAGLFPVALEIESLAIARGLIKDGTSKNAVLIVDLGATRTSFIIFSGHSLRFTASIPISSQGFTEAISRIMKVDLPKAEKLKMNYGLETRAAREGGEVFESLIPAITDLTEQIKRHLDYYQSHASNGHLPPEAKNIERILLCGGGANLKGLSGFLADELKVPVEIGDSWVNIFREPLPKNEKYPPVDSSAFTSALGLALRGEYDKSFTARK